MVGEETQVGALVRIKRTGTQSIIRELDRPLHVARVEIRASGAERWILLDELEPYERTWRTGA